MRIILLSGGSGKRLWPLSNEIRSKVFLKLLSTEDGGKESMIQRVCRQLDSVGLLPSTSIITHDSQVEITRSHVGDKITILSEPYKKGTFAAIGLAASYFHSQDQADPNETICILPVDTFVESEFFQLLHRFPDVLAQSQADIALIGTAPQYPSSQYGYIVPDPTSHNEQEYFTVNQFVEKPEKQHAIDLIRKQALWNCGIFAFSLSYMVSYLLSKGLPVRYEDWLQQYEQFAEISFDHEVVEKTNHSVVIPYHGSWKDLGSWETLSNHLGSNVIGSGQVSQNSVNTHLVNELSFPIQIIDLSNIIVAASQDGILVASKTSANQIKDKLGNIPPRPMYEEKRWGTYRVLDHSSMEHEKQTMTKKIDLLPGKNISYHLHQKRKEVWTILSGTGEFILMIGCFRFSVEMF
ncbi:sugar phosphate nucleotidyltransferase [Paenibacillus sp. N3.4]|uniref:sugar phosphate nucleotidyltransferase n=1 Tax=Paenibacillus sp. N3.4 TaxID=2603222 RepID=UPI0028FCD89A|nr:sugar phosphate nucleotidyltransferase [Paenibacillus sp. N3.4]